MSEETPGHYASAVEVSNSPAVGPGTDAPSDHTRAALTEQAGRLLAEHAYLRDEEVLDAQQRVTQTASWASSDVGDELVWSPNCFRLLGYEPGEVQPSRQLFMDRVHPMDRQIVLDAIAAARIAEFRIIRNDGVTRFFRVTQVAHLPASAGRPDRRIGIVQDMTDARRSDAVIRAHVAVSAALAGWESLERDAEGLLCQVATAIQCFRGAMWVPRNNAMVVVAHWEEEGAPEKDRILEVPVRYGKGATGIAWERGEPVCISDVRADPRYDGHEALVEASEIRGLLALPLLAGEEFVALAGFASHHPLDLSGSEYLSLDAFSQTLGRFLATRTAELGKPLLSRRERELLQLAAEGFSGGEIASQLHISRETVKSHFTHIYTKLDVSDRAEAVAVGMRLSLLS